MSVLGLLVVLIIVGVALYVLQLPRVPIAPSIKWLIACVLIVVCILYVLNAFGVIDMLNTVRVPRVHR